MEDKKEFHRALARTAVPITLQSLLQSSFSVVDQVMVGQLGSVSIAGIGLASKFSSLYSVLVSAVAAAAGIMMAQYMGKKDLRESGKSFYVNLFLSMGIAAVFMGISCGVPGRMMSMYTEDPLTREAAADYLRILGVSFLPLAVSTMTSVYLRCREAAMLPLYSGILAAVLNTVLNYVMIFGKLGCPAMGAEGAALATLVSRCFDCLVIVVSFLWLQKKSGQRLPFLLRTGSGGWQLYAGILFPILVCEFFWSLGENVYASIYGHMGTQSCAAMTLTGPVQVLMMGAMTGLSQGAGILVGKSLGRGEYEKAYGESRCLMKYGAAGSLLLSLILAAVSRRYVQVYQVEETVRLTAQHLLIVFALISPVKVQNMILGGGIIRSGGRTNYIMAIDLIGTWLFGVPLGFMGAFVLQLPITWVYFLLSLEECVRLLISIGVFRSRRWMKSL